MNGQGRTTSGQGSGQSRHTRDGRGRTGHALIACPCPSGPDVRPLAEARKKAWQRIQLEAPDVAALMAEVRRVFGARAGVGAVVELGGERVWPVGENG